MGGTDDDARADAPARAGAATAVELISAELSRSTPSWRTIRLLAARLVEIADRLERGLGPDGDSD
jgi:hypothetical protein